MQMDAAFFKNVLDSLHDGVYLTDNERRITYWNRAAERISGYSAAEVVETRCSDNILIHIDDRGTNLCRGLCPLAATIQDGQNREAEVFLHHKNGHRVPVSVRVAPLRDERGRVVGGVEIFNDNTLKRHMAQEIEKMRRLSLLDALTEIGNRRFAEGQLQGIVNEASRFSWLSGILLADIDKFKVVNDTYGHGAGDHTLQVVAQALRHGVRSFDHVCRWGGEEFLGIIRHVDATNLKLVAEKLRMLVEASAIPATPAAIHVTVSIGGTLIRNDDTTESVVKRADELMYASKSRGRNCVSIG